MLLPGTLASSTLGDVLGALHRADATGALDLVERRGPTAGRRHRVYVDRGLISALDSPIASARLGDVLRREGFVSQAALFRLAQRLADEPSRRAGELLVEDGATRSEIVDAALRSQLRSRLETLFALSDVSLSFHVVGARPFVADGALPLSPYEFLHGRPRRRDLRRAAALPRATASRASPRPRTLTVDVGRVQALSVLGLDRAADRDAIQRAFRRLAGRLHPDRFPRASSLERGELLRRFAQVSAAYHLLVA